MLEVFHVQYHNKSLFFGNFRHINIDPKLILLKGLSPLNVRERGEVIIPRRLTLRIGNKKRTFRGFFISEDDYAVQRFLGRYGVIKSDEISRVISDSWVLIYEKPYLVELRGRTYAFVKEPNSGVLSGWDRRDGLVYPIIAGWIGRSSKIYFYLHKIDASKNIAHFRFAPDPKNIPRTIIMPLSKGFIFDSFRMDEDGGDILPFPPYEVRYALRIYPPSAVLRTKDKPLPEEFDEPFIVKTFLPVSEGVRVIEASPGVVRSFVQNINGNVYAPGYANPHWESDYNELWRRSAGYILLCKLERFLESGVK